MPYRMGRGDYPRGGFLGNIGKALGGIAKGALAGFKKAGPLGAAGGALYGGVSSINDMRVAAVARSSGEMMAPIGGSVAATPAQDSPEELRRKHAANAEIYRTVQGAGVMHSARARGVAGIGGTRRTMRVTNVKALRRALRRANGFKELALKTIRLIDPTRKAKSFAGFKKGKRGR